MEALSFSTMMVLLVLAWGLVVVLMVPLVMALVVLVRVLVAVVLVALVVVRGAVPVEELVLAVALMVVLGMMSVEVLATNMLSTHGWRGRRPADVSWRLLACRHVLLSECHSVLSFVTLTHAHTLQSRRRL